MSLPFHRQAKAFLSPLQQKVTVFAVEGRESHLLLARFLLGCVAVTSKEVVILDTDAIYASNSDILTNRLDENSLENITLRIPAYDPIKTSLIDSIFSGYNILIVDDLNTVYHLLSMDDRSAIRELTAVAKILSYFCRENGKTAFLTAYSSGETFRKEVGQRSLLRIGDLSISTRTEGSAIRFECDQGRAWPDNTFSANLKAYFEL